MQSYDNTQTLSTALSMVWRNPAKKQADNFDYNSTYWPSLSCALKKLAQATGTQLVTVCRCVSDMYMYNMILYV